jgi:alkyldihydroxyacetonephosphate synthase
MQERRRKFYGRGYEDDLASPEISESEAAWSRLLGVDKFAAMPFPRADKKGWPRFQGTFGMG